MMKLSKNRVTTNKRSWTNETSQIDPSSDFKTKDFLPNHRRNQDPDFSFSLSMDKNTKKGRNTFQVSELSAF